MPTFTIPTRALARLRASYQTAQIAHKQAEDLLNAVVEAMGIDTEVPNIEIDLDGGVVHVPDVADAADVRLENGLSVQDFLNAGAGSGAEENNH